MRKDKDTTLFRNSNIFLTPTAQGTPNSYD